MDLKHYIGLRVRAERLRLGLTQDQLAEKIDKAVETISNIERGHAYTGLKTLEQLSEALCAPLVSFFEDVDHRRKKGKARLERELELRRLCEGLSDKDLSLAIRLLKGIRDEGQR